MSNQALMKTVSKINLVNKYETGIWIAGGVVTGVVIAAGLYCYHVHQQNQELIQRVGALERSNREMVAALDANTAGSAQLMGAIENFGKSQAALFTSLAALDRALSTPPPPTA
jgi:hypothetical protein